MRKYLIPILALVVCAAASAGDMANFINLGFSENSRYYMFAQYGIDTENFYPYADIFYVDVYNNKFVSNGVKSIEPEKAVEMGQTGFGAFLNLYAGLGSKTRELKIDHLMTGRLIYLLIDGEKPKEELEFRDFVRGNKYKVNLIQKSYGSGKSISAAFHLNVFITDKNGNTKSHIVGLPDYKRKGVIQYRIKQIMFSPDESGLVLVIEKEFYSEDGINVRYMVETVKL
jgi:predicted secreted protein